jgi:hypothetical protein
MQNTIKTAGSNSGVSREDLDLIVAQYWAIVGFKSEEEFERLQSDMASKRSRFLDEPPSPMENVCLFVLRKLGLAQHLVAFHLADVLHLNELTTSRCKGHHRALKSNLSSGQNTILDVVIHSCAQ